MVTANTILRRRANSQRRAFLLDSAERKAAKRRPGSKESDGFSGYGQLLGTAKRGRVVFADDFHHFKFAQRTSGTVDGDNSVAFLERLVCVQGNL